MASSDATPPPPYRPAANLIQENQTLLQKLAEAEMKLSKLEKPKSILEDAVQEMETNKDPHLFYVRLPATQMYCGSLWTEGSVQVKEDVVAFPFSSFIKKRPDHSSKVALVKLVSSYYMAGGQYHPKYQEQYATSRMFYVFTILPYAKWLNNLSFHDQKQALLFNPEVYDFLEPKHQENHTRPTPSSCLMM